MAKNETKHNANIGTSSLILIFIVLCLVTFGLLSLSNAKSDWNLAEKNKDAVTVYYEADAAGEEFVAMVDGIVRETGGRPDLLKAALNDYYRAETDTIATEIPMNFGQVLCVELKYADDLTYEIMTWKVYNQDEYEIDDSLPVWTGE